jgi:hypothetical protein
LTIALSPRIIHARFQQSASGKLVVIEPDSLIATESLPGRSVIALRRRNSHVGSTQENEMSKDAKRGALLDRRTLLQAGAASALAAPLGVFGAQAFPYRAAAPKIDFSEFPICKTSSDTPPLMGAPRKLKLSWNGSHRDRQDRCRPRHGVALAEAAGAGV